jgi:hypothetical protein
LSCVDKNIDQMFTDIREHLKAERERAISIIKNDLQNAKEKALRRIKL